MRIEDQGDVFSAEFVNEHNGLVNISIGVSSRGFSGHNEQVGFWLNDLEDFLADLTTLERVRQGKAILESLNKLPEHRELRLECFSLDKLGHMGLDIELLRIRYVGNQYRPYKVSLAFEIDPGYLPYLVSEFS
ncbi:MAG: hypothetical protein ABI690_30065 [Chloroflexota bacterium]